VVTAGWTSGSWKWTRTIRFSAADWRDGDKPNKDKLATAIANVLSKTFAAKPASLGMESDDRGAEIATFKRRTRPAGARPHRHHRNHRAGGCHLWPAGGASDRLVLWISAPSVSTADEGTGPKLNLADESRRDRKARPRTTTAR
jgi:hypothetical protein